MCVGEGGYCFLTAPAWVLQDSILSPLLFNTYMKLLGEVTHQLGLWYCHYANHTQVCLLTPVQPNKAVEVVSQCLEAMWVYVMESSAEGESVSQGPKRQISLESLACRYYI